MPILMNPKCALVHLANDLLRQGKNSPKDLTDLLEANGYVLKDPSAVNDIWSRAAKKYLHEPVEFEKLSRQAKIDLANELAKAQKSGFLEAATQLRRAGLLTGPRTLGRNFVGNTATLVTDEIARIPGSLADMAMGAFTKTRTLSGPDPMIAKQAITAAVTTGLKDSVEILKYGTPVSDLLKFDIPKQLNTGIKAIDKYVDFVFRVQLSADRPFREYAMSKSLLEQTKRLAKNQGEYDELLRHPTEAMFLQAIADSEEAVFANKNAISRGLSAATGVVDKMTGTKSGSFVMDTLVPFKTVPTNIAGRVMESSPLGGIKLAVLAKKAFKNKKLDPETQKEIAKTFGRATTGTGLLILGYHLYNSGDITPTISDSEKERGLEEAAGRTPASLKVNGRWYKLHDSPQGMLLAVGAALARDNDQPLLIAGVKATGRQILETPMMQGVSDAEALVRRPDTEGEKFSTGMAGSLIPTGVADIAAIGDENVRSARTPLDAIKNRVPGLKDEVPVKHDAFGKPIQAGALIHPLGGSKDKNDPVIKEMTRLKVGITKTDRDKDLKESEAEYQARVKFIGQYVYQELLKAVKDPLYIKDTPEGQKYWLEQVIKQAKTTAGKEARFQRQKSNPSRPANTP